MDSCLQNCVLFIFSEFYLLFSQVLLYLAGVVFQQGEEAASGADNMVLATFEEVVAVLFHELSFEHIFDSLFYELVAPHQHSGAACIHLIIKTRFQDSMAQAVALNVNEVVTIQGELTYFLREERHAEKAIVVEDDNPVFYGIVHHLYGIIENAIVYDAAFSPGAFEKKRDVLDLGGITNEFYTVVQT